MSVAVEAVRTTHEAEPETDEVSDVRRRGAWRLQNDEPAVISIGNERFRVHPHGGGLVSLTAFVTPGVFVGPHASVKGRAIVVGAVRLFDRSVVEGSAIVGDSCTLREESSIGGEAVVRRQVTLTGHARIDGDARVNGGVLLQYYAHISRGVLSGAMTIS